MSKQHRVLFFIILTAALSLPIAESFFAARETVVADKLANSQPLQLSGDLGEFKFVRRVEVKEPNVVHNVYLSPAGQRLAVVERQCSTYRSLHELFYCLLANGWYVDKLGKLQIYSTGSPVDAQLLRVRTPTGACLALLWYQWPGGSSAYGDPFLFIKTRLNSVFGHSKPLMREIEICTFDPETPKDAEVMRELAARVVEQPF
ncbi:MAG TPA: hypothetical protein V6C81_01905 [Planktothrix sp.]